MQNLKVILGLATCAVSLSLANQTIAGDTQVRGTTLRATEIGIDKYDYTPLPNVRIKAYRTGPLLKYLVKSNQKGDFDFKVPSGAPFKVLFYLDNDTVPEMQNLAGKDGMFHEC